MLFLFYLFVTLPPDDFPSITFGGAYLVTAIGPSNDGGAYLVTAIGSSIEGGAYLVTAIGSSYDGGAYLVTATGSPDPPIKCNPGIAIAVAPNPTPFNENKPFNNDSVTSIVNKTVSLSPNYKG